MSMPSVQRPSTELAEVDTIVQRAVAAGNPLIITDYCNSLHRQAVAKGVALAKSLYGLRANWTIFQAAGIEGDWDDFASAHMTHVQAATARRYANMWESVFEREFEDPSVKESLLLVPVQNLVAIAAGVKEGQITDEDLADVPLKDYSAIQDMVRGARGKQTSSETRVIGILVVKELNNVPRGTLYAKQGDVRESIALFNLHPETEAGKILLERIKNAVGLVERDA